MKIHPAAKVFPEMSGADYEALKADIAEHGLLVPIVTWRKDGSVLDGRHRLRACEELGIDPRAQLWEGDSPTAYVLSANLRRRHLTPSQAAAVAVEALPLLEEEAKERQRAGQASGGRGHRKEPPPNDLGDVSAHSGEAVAKAAEACGTNRQYVADAKKIKEADPEAFEAVKRGEKSVPQAKREDAAVKRQRKPPKRYVPTPDQRMMDRRLALFRGDVGRVVKKHLARWPTDAPRAPLREAGIEELRTRIKGQEDA